MDMLLFMYDEYDLRFVYVVVLLYVFCLGSLYCVVMLVVYFKFGGFLKCCG